MRAALSSRTRNLDVVFATTTGDDSTDIDLALSGVGRNEGRDPAWSDMPHLHAVAGRDHVEDVGRGRDKDLQRLGRKAVREGELQVGASEVVAGAVGSYQLRAGGHRRPCNLGRAQGQALGRAGPPEVDDARTVRPETAGRSFRPAH